MPDDTIYAVSSGRPPAAIAVMRVSGPGAGAALARLAGLVPTPRVATLRTLRSVTGDVLDRGLILWFPGPASATGEDLAELHLHGGIAVVAAVSGALTAIGLRQAEPGEFTRRAVLNGRLDLNEAEGLADLLAAETEGQRREALLRATGSLGREIDGWTDRLLAIVADVERAIDHEEDDTEGRLDIAGPLQALHDDIADVLSRPSAERLRDGVRVAIVGPVNAGKSSLFNALVGDDAAIVTPIAGTTRDVIERPVVIGGLPFVLMDTAGLRRTDDAVESIGIGRARAIMETADLVLDLSDGAQTMGRHVAVTAKVDIGEAVPGRIAVSALSGTGLAELTALLTARGTAMLPGDGETTLDARQRDALRRIVVEIGLAIAADDLLIVAEYLMAARRAFDLLTGRAGIDDLLDTLFARFCLGK